MSEIKSINPEWARHLKEAALKIADALDVHRTPGFALEDVVAQLWEARARLDRAIRFAEAAYFQEEDATNIESEAQIEIEDVIENKLGGKALQ